MYENIALHTGLPPEETQRGPLSAAQARAVGEERSALLAASSLPRDEAAARRSLLAACREKGLARFALSREGRPALPLALAAARFWGNVRFGLREGRGGEWEAFARDMESNVTCARRFTPHRDGEEEGKARLLAALLDLLPAPLLEEALAACRDALHADAPAEEKPGEHAGKDGERREPAEHGAPGPEKSGGCVAAPEGKGGLPPPPGKTAEPDKTAENGRCGKSPCRAGILAGREEESGTAPAPQEGGSSPAGKHAGKAGQAGKARAAEEQTEPGGEESAEEGSAPCAALKPCLKREVAASPGGTAP